MQQICHGYLWWIIYTRVNGDSTIYLSLPMHFLNKSLYKGQALKSGATETIERSSDCPAGGIQIQLYFFTDMIC